MSNYEKTKRKLQHLVNKSSENETALSRLDIGSPKKTSIYYIKNKLKYYIFKDENVSQWNYISDFTIDLYNFPEKYLSYFNIIGITYANHEEYIPPFYYFSLEYNSFIKITDNHYQLKFDIIQLYSYYTAYLDLYFIINLPRDDNE